jgi:hypothetical protein
MKIITVWQPYASLIAIGMKPFEFRGWAPPASIVGQRIGIHAAARKVRPEEIRTIIEQVRERPWEVCLHVGVQVWLDEILRHPEILPLSAIVCTAELWTPEKGFDVSRRWGWRGDVGQVAPNYAWPMQNVRRLEEPIGAKGRQGFWDHEVAA